MLSSAVALSACAASTASSPNNSFELMAEVHALRADNTRLEQRIDRLEKERVVTRAVSSRPASAPATPVAEPAPRASVGAEIPQLTVVKLKPKKEQAQKIETAIEVQEPAENELDNLKSQLENDSATRERDDVVDAAYEKAVTALKTGNVSGGVTALMRIAAENPRHPRADNALYFAGLGQMGLNNTPEAAKLFTQVVDLYPAGDAVQDALLKLAECRLKMNRPREARAVYEKVVAEFPGSAAATQAQARLTRF